MDTFVDGRFNHYNDYCSYTLIIHIPSLHYKAYITIQDIVIALDHSGRACRICVYSVLNLMYSI